MALAQKVYMPAPARGISGFLLYFKHLNNSVVKKMTRSVNKNIYALEKKTIDKDKNKINTEG